MGKGRFQKKSADGRINPTCSNADESEFRAAGTGKDRPFKNGVWIGPGAPAVVRKLFRTRNDKKIPPLQVLVALSQKPQFTKRSPNGLKSSLHRPQKGNEQRNLL